MAMDKHKNLILSSFFVLRRCVVNTASSEDIVNDAKNQSCDNIGSDCFNRNTLKTFVIVAFTS